MGAGAPQQSLAPRERMRPLGVVLGVLAGLAAVSCSDGGVQIERAPQPTGVGGLQGIPTGPGPDGAGRAAGGAAAGAAATSGIGAGPAGRSGSGAGTAAAPGSVAGPAAAMPGALPADAGIRPAFRPTGVPFMAPERAWTWLPFSSSKCRAGAMAGIGINLSAASKNLMLFLDGGGACFDAATCATSPSAIMTQQPAAAGVFDRANPENPVKDWSFIYVPYCTGDVHMGAEDAGHVPGVDGIQHFVGRTNLEAFLHRIVPTFSDAAQVLLTGVSAGGFGASANAAFVQWAFGAIPVAVIDDSGPLMSEDYAPKCLAETYKAAWGLASSILRDCGGSCSPDGDYTIEFLKHVLDRASGRSLGLIESVEDPIIRGYFGVGTNNGANDCQGTLLLTPMDPTRFRDGLLDFRERVRGYPGASTFYPTGSQHPWLTGNNFYTGTAGGVRLVDWFRGILEGAPASHLGPN